MNDVFLFIKQASAHKFADDNALLSFAKTFVVLTRILTLELNNVIALCSEDRMIVNPDQFQSIVF